MNWYATLKYAMPLPRVKNEYPKPLTQEEQYRATEGWAGMISVGQLVLLDIG
jgi:hypothetical protein